LFIPMQPKPGPQCSHDLADPNILNDTGRPKVWEDPRGQRRSTHGNLRPEIAFTRAPETWDSWAQLANRGPNRERSRSRGGCCRPESRSRPMNSGRRPGPGCVREESLVDSMLVMQKCP